MEDTDEQVAISHNWGRAAAPDAELHGIVRTTRRLERALHRIRLLRSASEDYYANFRVNRDLLALRNLVECAELRSCAWRCSGTKPRAALQPRLSRHAAGELPDRVVREVRSRNKAVQSLELWRDMPR